MLAFSMTRLCSGGLNELLLVPDSTVLDDISNKEQQQSEATTDREVNPAEHIAAQQFRFVVALPRTVCISSPSRHRLIAALLALLILHYLSQKVTQTFSLLTNFPDLKAIKAKLLFQGNGSNSG